MSGPLRTVFDPQSVLGNISELQQVVGVTGNSGLQQDIQEINETLVDNFNSVETKLTEILTKLENTTRLPISEIKIGFFAPIRGQLSSIGLPLLNPAITPILEISNYSEQEKKEFFDKIDTFTGGTEEILKLEMKNINLGNDSNGSNGSNITFYIANTASDDFSPAKAIENANKLIQEGIQIIIGPTQSSVSLELIPEIAIKNNIPIISYLNTSPDLTTTQNNGLYSRVIQSDLIQASLVAKLAKQKSNNAVVIYSENTIFIKDKFISEFQNNGGSILKQISYTGLDSIKNELEQISSQDFIIYFTGFYYEVSQLDLLLEYFKNVVKNSKAYYFNTDFYIQSLYDESFDNNLQFFPNNSYMPASGKSELIQNYYSKVNSQIVWSSDFKPQVYDCVALSLLALSIDNNISGSLFTSIISKLTEKSNNEYIRASELRQGLNLLNENKIINYRGYAFSNLSVTPGNGYEPTDTIENLNTYTLFTIENNEFVKVEFLIN